MHILYKNRFQVQLTLWNQLQLKTNYKIDRENVLKVYKIGTGFN